MMKQYQLAMPQQVFSGETGMQALESLAARHKKAAVFTDAGIRASGVLERPLAELDKAAVPYVVYGHPTRRTHLRSGPAGHRYLP